MDQDKDPGTHCCNEIIVKIELPGESMKTLDLDVQRVKLVVQSKKQCVVAAEHASRAHSIVCMPHTMR
jgi:hypothetical protein